VARQRERKKTPGLTLVFIASGNSYQNNFLKAEIRGQAIHHTQALQSLPHE
jgi:hypothetical protein